MEQYWITPHYKKALLVLGTLGAGFWLWNAVDPKVSEDELGGGTYQSLAVYKEYSKEELDMASKEDSQQFKRPESDKLKTVLILFGTEYGASKEISSSLSEKILEQLKEEGFWPRCVNMEDYQWIDFDKEQLVLIVCSTYGDGLLMYKKKYLIQIPKKNKRYFHESLTRLN